MSRITLRIDRIVSAGPGLDRALLEAALRREIAELVAREGVGVLGQGGHRQRVQADLSPDPGALAPRVAAAAIKAVLP